MVKEVDRLLRNRANEPRGYLGDRVGWAIGARKHFVLALDWTTRDARFGCGLYRTRIYDRWLRANTAKLRSLPLLRQGQVPYERVPNVAEQRLRPLMQRSDELVVAQSAITAMFGFI